MKSTLIQISDIIVMAAETKAAMFKLKAYQQSGLLYADIISIMAITGLTVLILSF